MRDTIINRETEQNAKRNDMKIIFCNILSPNLNMIII
jgi:hypothetical protein